MTEIGTLRAVRESLQMLEVKATRQNLDILLGCLQALDDLIVTAEAGEKHD